MQLRDGHLVGGSPAPIPVSAAATFAAGVRAVLARWTALRLAVEGEWGGVDSGAKAEQMARDVEGWFARGKGKRGGGGGGRGGRMPRLAPPPSSSPDHYADDLEDELDQAMLADFHAQLEDGSPRDVAHALVALHSDLSSGAPAALARVAAMLAAAPPPLGASVRVRVDRDGTEVGRRAAGGADGASSSSDDGDDSMSDGGARTPAPRAPRAAPVVDEDGFQTVVRRQ